MMADRSSVHRLTEALAGAQREWRTRGQAEARARPAQPGLTIALSREAGTPGTSVARAVGERLGWTVYDHELLERIAEEMGVRTALLESVDERRISWVQECMQAFAAVPSVSESTYVSHLIETVLALGALGNCVLVGRGTPQMLPPESTLRVRLIAPREARVAAVGQRLGITRPEAEHHVESVDRERGQFVRYYFGRDPSDPRLYDLILDASRFPVTECAAVIVQALHGLEAQPARTPAAPATMLQRASAR
jgi:cytidylate kinase